MSKRSGRLASLDSDSDSAPEDIVKKQRVQKIVHFDKLPQSVIDFLAFTQQGRGDTGVAPPVTLGIGDLPALDNPLHNVGQIPGPTLQFMGSFAFLDSMDPQLFNNLTVSDDGWDGFQNFGEKYPLVCALPAAACTTKSVKSRERTGGQALNDKHIPYNLEVFRPTKKGARAIGDKRFVVLGVDHPEPLYVNMDDLIIRLGGDREEQYKRDWEAVRAKQRPFEIWNSNGSSWGTQIPARLIARDTPKAKTTRAIRQLQNWMRVAEKNHFLPAPEQDMEVEHAAHSNVAMRYWDAACSDVPLMIEYAKELSEPVMREFVEEIVAAIAFKPATAGELEPVTYQPMDVNCVERDKKWVLIGKHLLDLYRLYTTKAGQKKLATAGQHKAPRSIPTAEQALNAHLMMFPDDKELLEQRGLLVDEKKVRTSDQGAVGGETETPMSGQKVGDMRGQKRPVSQLQAMNQQSATKLAKLFQWEEEGTQWKGQAEWLHRAAFSFGGMHTFADARSSQTYKNLIFGTHEANTLMIRPESTIKHLTSLERDRLKAIMADRGTTDPDLAKRIMRSTKLTGTVKTRILYCSFEAGDAPRGGPLTPLDAASQTRVPPPDPAHAQLINDPNSKFMKWENYPWLAPMLEYEYQINFDQRHMTRNTKIIIDPFARVIPLRLEDELDKRVELHIFGKGTVKPMPDVPGVEVERPQDTIGRERSSTSRF